MVITTSTQGDPGSDNDSISLTSTIISTHSEDELFEVQRILAENPENKKKTYLIQWVGYPISRATWEPRKQIQHLRHIISEWRERQKQQSSGIEEGFDVSAWDDARAESENERQTRKNRRATKRKRLQRAANHDFELELESQSRSYKKPILKDQKSLQVNTDKFIKNEPEPGAKSKNNSELIPKQKNIRAKRKVISDDDDETIRYIEQSSENPCLPLIEAHSLYSPVSTTQNKSSAQSSPDSAKLSASTKIRRPSSSSNESLTQIIRRSKLKKTACLATNKPKTGPSEECNASISGHITSSSSSDDAPLAKRLLLPNQKPSIASASDISQSKTCSNSTENFLSHENTPCMRKDRYYSRSRNSSTPSSGLYVSTKRNRRQRSIRENILSTKPPTDHQIEQDISLDTNVNTSTKQNHLKSSDESIFISGDMGSFIKPSDSSFYEQMDTRPSEIDPNKNGEHVESSSYMNMSEPRPDPTNEKAENSTHPRLSHEILDTNMEFGCEPLKSRSLNQRLDRPDLKKLTDNVNNINIIDHDCDSSYPISNASEVEAQMPLSPSYNENILNQEKTCKSSQVHLIDPLLSEDVESPPRINTYIDNLSPNSYSNPDNSERISHFESQSAPSTTETSENLQWNMNHDIQTNNSTNHKSLDINSMTSNVQRDIEMSSSSPESSALLYSPSNPPIINHVTQNSLESNDSADNPSHGRVAKVSVSGQVFPHESEDCNLPLEPSNQSERNIVPTSVIEDHNLTSEPPLSSTLEYETQSLKNQSEVDFYDEEKRRFELNSEEILLKSRTCQSFNPSSFKAQVTTSPKKREKKKNKKWTKKMCKYWLTNNCNFGALCRNIHDISSLSINDKAQDFTEREKSVNPLQIKNSLQMKQKTLEYDASSEDGTRPVLDSVIKSSDETPVQLSPSNISTVIENPSHDDLNETPGNFPITVQCVTESVDHQVPGGPEFQSELVPIVDTAHVAAADPHQISTCSNEQIDSNQDKINVITCIKKVVIGSDSLSSIFLNFGNIQTVTDDAWKKIFISIEKINFNKSCIAQDFQGQYFMSRFVEVGQGNIYTESPNDQDATKAIDMIFNELVIRCAGLIATVGKFYILIFPVRREEWRFLDRSPDSSSEFRLRYSIISNNFFNKQQDLSSSCARILFHQQLYPQRSQKILIMNLLEHFLPGVGNCSPECRFYLLFPPAASEIADLVKFCLISHNPNFKLYGSLTEGSWDMFTQAHFPIDSTSPPKEVIDSIVLIHEVSATEICRIPRLSTILNNTDMMFWQISDGTLSCPPYPSRYFLPNAKLGQISATRLFPHGCAILLTPSFLVAEPRAALEFIKWVEIERFQMQFPLWRLVGAHNLPLYVLDVAKSKANEASSYERRHSKDPRRNSVMKERFLDYSTCNIRWGLYAELAKISQSSNDELDSMEDFESCLIQAPPFINPDNEHELIRWFAAWSAINSDIHRKFIVIGTDSSNATHAKYLKEIPKRNRDVNIIATGRTLSQNSASSMEMRPLQKSRQAEKSSPLSKPQTPDTLNSEISYGRASDSPDRNSLRTANAPRNVSDCVDPNYGRSKNTTDFHDILSKENIEAAPRNSSKPCHILSYSFINCNRIEKNDEQEIKAHYEEDFVSRTSVTSDNREGCSVALPPVMEFKEQQFEATTEWYQRLKARGNGWEHITVAEHLEAWQILEYNRTQ